MTLVHDIVLFTTREKVVHHFALARAGTMEPETRLRAIGYPLGAFDKMIQTEPVTYQDELWYEVPVDKDVQGGFSGAPFFDEDGHVAGMLSASNDNMVSAIKAEVMPRRHRVLPLLGRRASLIPGP